MIRFKLPNKLGEGLLIAPRYFTDLNAASSMYYTIPEVTLAGDFRVEFESLSTTSSNTMILANSANLRPYFFAKPLDGVFEYAQDAQFPISPPVVLGKLNAMSFTRSGSDMVIETRGVSTTTALSTSPTLSVNVIGQRQSALYHTGYIVNLKIYDNGTLIRHYPLDDAPDSTTIRELVSGANGTKVNITPAATELYTFNATANQWESTTSAKVIPLT